MGVVEEHTVDIDVEDLAGSSSREELRPVSQAHVVDEHGHGKGIASPGDEQVVELERRRTQESGFR